jgi:hypothetical protein
MRKRRKVLFTSIAVVLGLVVLVRLVVLVATWESDRDHVEALHLQIPEVVQLVTGNSEAFDLLLEIKDRVNEFNANPINGVISAISSYTLDMRTEDVRIHVFFEKTSSKPSRDVKLGDEANFLTAADRRVLLDALSGYSVFISPGEIGIQMSWIGFAELIVMHPPSAAFGYNERGSQNHWVSPLNSDDYSYYSYFEIIDENWLIEIYNAPKG